MHNMHYLLVLQTQPRRSFDMFIWLILFYLFVKMIKSEDVEYFAPSLFLNHGGGPNPVLREKHNIEIADSLKNVSQIVDLSKLKAIIVVTAHREEEVLTISSGLKHELIYDYNNFPPESYSFKYEASGDPILAQKLQDAFKKEGIPSALDDQRGWDHGVFIPLMLINPAANIPIVQVSILKNQDAAKHFEIGKVLYQFRKEAVAIFGSGMSYHNMREFKKALKDESDDKIVNNNFDAFLNEVCTGDLEKRKEILYWDKVPEGLEAHPVGEADHLMPLMVNAGAAGGQKPGRRIFQSIFLKKFKLSAFIWDNE